MGIKPCTSDTEPGVVEETVRNENDLEPSTTKAGKPGNDKEATQPSRSSLC